MNALHTLSICQLDFGYPQKKLFDGFSCEAVGGLLVCGNNGSGKTTLLRLIAGLLPPAGGKILLNLSAHYTASVCFSTDALVPGADVATHLSWVPAADYHTSAGEIIKKAGLEKYKNDKICNLSCGLRKILAIAIACYTPADIVVIDEVFSGLDEQMRGRAADMIEAMLSAGKYIVLATQTPVSLPFEHQVLQLP